MSLKQWAKSNSKFLKLADNESFTGTYLGYIFTVNKEGKKLPCFEFRDGEGNVKMLQSQSTALCNAFDENEGAFKKGEKVKITRRGLEMNTKYEVVGADVIF